MKIVTAAEMRAIDLATSEKYGVPSSTLMENAGAAVAEVAVQQFPHAERIAVICGGGNNGGDGFVAARKLHEAGKEVLIVLLSSPDELKGDAATMLSRVPSQTRIVRTESDLTKIEFSEFHLLIDAILGTGFRPPVEGLYAQAISAINNSEVPVIAIDIPSGADADATRPSGDSTLFVRADSIITFTALKSAHVFQFSPTMTVVKSIGTPDEAIVSELKLNLIQPEDFVGLLMPRKPDSNKGDFGHVLVIGGSLGKAGAAAMTGMAALRSGAGLVTVGTPKTTLSVVAGFAPELMTEPLLETESGSISILALEQLREKGILAAKDVFAIGPGLSLDRETAQFCRTFVDRASIPVVLDADGLNALEGHVEYLRGGARPIVITPHPGEMARLTGCSVTQIQADRIGVARRFAQEHQVYVVLKGHRTLVEMPDGECWVNTTGNPGMATAGTGDILTGVIAAMIGQHSQAIATAVIAAVYIHGLAGDIARNELGEISLNATDLLHTLPRAFMQAANLAGIEADTLS